MYRNRFPETQHQQSAAANLTICLRSSDVPTASRSQAGDERRCIPELGLWQQEFRELGECRHFEVGTRSRRPRSSIGAGSPRCLSTKLSPGGRLPFLGQSEMVELAWKIALLLLKLASKRVKKRLKWSTTKWKIWLEIWKNTASGRRNVPIENWKNCHPAHSQLTFANLAPASRGLTK